ncbi:hypothetical protein HMPREF0494_0862 [Limosilactobacillus antri DSM 16041]|uniref:Uncharacterized protein n=1 Tax=Limosilactobacillus antri DSM 16041 TaxID=525309 RepID=C8P6B8_9LACO|nr:hypothetical protein HMPREF0494_0862 [Limosilactobacillus antri DSM 16041]
MATPRSKPMWGSSSADLSASELPASYCAAFFVITDNKKAGNKIPAFCLKRQSNINAY